MNLSNSANIHKIVSGADSVTYFRLTSLCARSQFRTGKGGFAEPDGARVAFGTGEAGLAVRNGWGIVLEFLRNRRRVARQPPERRRR